MRRRRARQAERVSGGDEYAEYFRGAKSVVVVADTDTPGYRHARDVAQSLRAVVEDLIVCAPAEGKDAFEHLTFGHSLDDFEVVDGFELDQLSGLFDVAASVRAIASGEPFSVRQIGVTEEPEKSDQIAVASDGYRLTDAGNAQRFIDEASGRVRFVHEWSRWIVWRDGRWNVDASDAMVTEMAKQVRGGFSPWSPNPR